jgi:hypothetical protein
LMSAVCVWTQVVLSPTATLFAFHWSIRWGFLLLVEGERCFFFCVHVFVVLIVVLYDVTVNLFKQNPEPTRILVDSHTTF